MKLQQILLSMILAIPLFADAKELTLYLHPKTDYPVSLEYQFSSENKIYASGKFDSLSNGDDQIVAVNRITDSDQIWIKILKISSGNITVFGDPCEILLPKEDLRADITLGISGNVKAHGQVRCEVEKSKDDHS